MEQHRSKLAGLPLSWFVGDECDAQDENGDWWPATIVDREDHDGDVLVTVHFEGWCAKYNDRYELPQPHRLLPRGSVQIGSGKGWSPSLFADPQVRCASCTNVVRKAVSLQCDCLAVYCAQHVHKPNVVHQCRECKAQTNGSQSKPHVDRVIHANMRCPGGCSLAPETLGVTRAIASRAATWLATCWTHVRTDLSSAPPVRPTRRLTALGTRLPIPRRWGTCRRCWRPETIG